MHDRPREETRKIISFVSSPLTNPSSTECVTARHVHVFKNPSKMLPHKILLAHRHRTRPSAVRLLRIFEFLANANNITGSLINHISRLSPRLCEFDSVLASPMCHHQAIRVQLTADTDAKSSLTHFPSLINHAYSSSFRLRFASTYRMLPTYLKPQYIQTIHGLRSTQACTI